MQTQESNNLYTEVNSQDYISINPEYLQPQEELLYINPTTGIWKREDQEKVFTYHIDLAIEELGCVSAGDKHTLLTTARLYYAIDSGPCTKFIPRSPEFFFENLTQAVQVFKDNPKLLEEIILSNQRMMVPFITRPKKPFFLIGKSKNEKMNYFIADIYRYANKVGLKVHKITEYFNMKVQKDKQFAFIFPEKFSK